MKKLLAVLVLPVAILGAPGIAHADEPPVTLPATPLTEACPAGMFDSTPNSPPPHDCVPLDQFGAYAGRTITGPASRQVYRSSPTPKAKRTTTSTTIEPTTTTTTVLRPATAEPDVIHRYRVKFV